MPLPDEPIPDWVDDDTLSAEETERRFDAMMDEAEPVHVCDPEHSPDCAAYLHYSDSKNREPAPGTMWRRRKVGGPPTTEPEARYFHVGAPDRVVSRTVCLGDNVLIDMDEKSDPIGVEILGRCEEETHADSTRD